MPRGQKSPAQRCPKHFLQQVWNEVALLQLQGHPSVMFVCSPGCVCDSHVSLHHADDPPDPGGDVTRRLRGHQVLPVPRHLAPLRPTGRSWAACLLGKLQRFLGLEGWTRGTAGELLLIDDVAFGEFGKAMLCVGMDNFFNWKVPWLINEDFQSRLLLVLLPLRGKSVATSSVQTNLNGIWPIFGSLLAPNLNLRHNQQRNCSFRWLLSL